MLSRILLLMSLTCCVCGAFEVNVTRFFNWAEENQNITLEWTFTTKAGSSLHSLKIECLLLTNAKNSVLFLFRDGGEVSESQDEDFTGRVQCDTDDLKEGRIRLHVSPVRVNDSGLYHCEVSTDYGSGWYFCHLNVTAAQYSFRLEADLEAEPERLHTWSWGWRDVSSRLALSLGLGGVLAAFFLHCYRLIQRRP